MIAALLLAAQAVAATPPPGAGVPPQRIYLVNCPLPVGDEIVVCGDTAIPRLPLPDERERPDLPRQPTGDPMAGMDNAGTGVCASSQGGCISSVDLGAIALTAANVVGKALRKKPDKSGRVAIALDAPPPTTEGRLLP